MVKNHLSTRRERRIAARKAQILNAAAAIFSQKGFERATTREIAAAADVSEGTLYNYFGSKRDLLLGLVQNIAAETLQNLDSVQLGDVEATMQHIFTHRFQQARSRRLLTLLLHEARLQPDVYYQYVQQVLEPIRQGLETAMRGLIAEGAMRPLDPAVAARALIGLSMGFAVLFELGGDPVLADIPAGQLAAAVTDIFLNGLRGEVSSRQRSAVGGQLSAVSRQKMEARND